MKIKRNGYDIFINAACPVLLLGILVFLALRWRDIPDRIPGHYNAAGVVDRWGKKGELLVVPIISWIMYIGMTLVECFPHIWNTGARVTKQNEARVYRIIKNLIGTMKLLFVLNFTSLTMNSSFSRALPQWHLPVLLMLVFGSLIFFIIKLVRAR